MRVRRFIEWQLLKPDKIEQRCWYMSDEVIANMKERVVRVRRVVELAHDPEMIAVLEALIKEAEVDIERLEVERGFMLKKSARPAPAQN